MGTLFSPRGLATFSFLNKARTSEQESTHYSALKETTLLLCSTGVPKEFKAVQLGKDRYESSNKKREKEKKQGRQNKAKTEDREPHVE